MAIENVKKGQRITASKFNETLDAVNALTNAQFYDAQLRKTGVPDAFHLQANTQVSISGSTVTYELTRIDIVNNWWNEGNGVNRIDDKHITDFEGLANIYFVRKRATEDEPAGTPMVLTNNEMAGISRNEYIIIPLYYIEVDAANGVCEIRYDFRQQITLFGNGAGGGGGGECGCNITPYYTEYDEEGHRNNHIATWTNGIEIKEIYAPGGNGDGTTLKGNTYDSVKVDGDLEFEAAENCNIEVKTVGNKITIGVYYI